MSRYRGKCSASDGRKINSLIRLGKLALKSFSQKVYLSQQQWTNHYEYLLKETRPQYTQDTMAVNGAGGKVDINNYTAIFKNRKSYGPKGIY